MFNGEKFLEVMAVTDTVEELLTADFLDYIYEMYDADPMSMAQVIFRFGYYLGERGKKSVESTDGGSENV